MDKGKYTTLFNSFTDLVTNVTRLTWIKESIQRCLIPLACCKYLYTSRGYVYKAIKGAENERGTRNQKRD
jgi:hypothetical protein